MPIELENIHKEFSSWVIECLKDEDIKDVEIELTGTSEKGDNYMGDIIFAKANGTNSEGRNKTIDLVIKKGKENTVMEEAWDSRSCYVRENIMYDRIFPAFRNFEMEKNHKDMFDAVPKCYGILAREAYEAVLLENLKSRGYKLYDRFVSMNIDHIKLILENYAKFHAISFAMRDQNREKFDEISKGMHNLFEGMLKEGTMNKWYETNTKKCVEMIEETDPELAQRFKEKIEKGVVNMLLEIAHAEIDELVITHGDCWNNNFMFKYEDSKSPSEVKILDWQVSNVQSPIADLSYFLHIVSSTDQVQKLEELLLYYHKNLSRNIKELGSDPEKLFPLSTLLEHWEKYSFQGISILITSLELMTCDKKDALDMSEFKKPEDALTAWNTVKPKNYDLYRERIISNVRKYCDGLNILV